MRVLGHRMFSRNYYHHSFIGLGIKYAFWLLRCSACQSTCVRQRSETSCFRLRHQDEMTRLISHVTSMITTSGAARASVQSTYRSSTSISQYLTLHDRVAMIHSNYSSDTRRYDCINRHEVTRIHRPIDFARSGYIDDIMDGTSGTPFYSMMYPNNYSQCD